MQSVFKVLALFCSLCAFAVNCPGLDRESFSFPNYDLNVRIEPEQHRLGARGKIRLRNDSTAAQKVAVLQISSSLDWRSIKVGDKAVQFVTQPYTSDIDHTGALSEAIVTLPEPVAPGATVELDIAYEGVILRNATRLTRIGTPEEVAKSTDWDQIDASFTAVRGVGYVAWYPIATESANLSDESSLDEVLGRWKARQAGSKARLKIDSSFSGDPEPQIIFDGMKCEQMTVGRTGMGRLASAQCNAQASRFDAPMLLIADYQVLERPGIEVRFFNGHNTSAANFADSAEKVVPLITDWFGKQRERAKVADLPDPNSAPFESGALLLTPLATTNSTAAGLAAAHQLTHAAFVSFRPWIEEGLAHFAQALYLEQEKGRQAGLEYMRMHRTALMQFEQTSAPHWEDEAKRSLVKTVDEELYRSKAMCVWWMLRDMVGDAALKKALAAYRPEQDKEPSYMQRLIAAESPRDLEWFFDDWVYRDHGLPDFKVESVFPRKTMTGTFLVTVTVDNLGSAGAEVPLTVKFAGGGVTKRLEVRAKSKGTIRIETPAMPQEVVVNDGSVPESDTTNNVFKVESDSGE